MTTNFEQQPGPDLREVKQRLTHTKDQRMELIIRLGELAYESLRGKKEDISSLRTLSNEILQKDIIIYQSQATISKLSASSHQCPNCSQPVGDEAKFCGNCGTLNPSYQDPNVSQVLCNHCEQLIEAQLTYCPCCGVIQEGK
nr:zinc ribbon domain-containing protein [Lysinibacillus timonensis]